MGSNGKYFIFAIFLDPAGRRTKILRSINRYCSSRVFGKIELYIFYGVGLVYALETHGSRVQTFVPTVLLKIPPLASGFWRAWNSMLPFSLWGLTPQGLQTLVTTLLLKQSLWGSCNTTFNPCNQKLLFFLPSIRKLSWALAGNFLAWQLQGQISAAGALGWFQQSSCQLL